MERAWFYSSHILELTSETGERVSSARVLLKTELPKYWRKMNLQDLFFVRWILHTLGERFIQCTTNLITKNKIKEGYGKFDQ